MPVKILGGDTLLAGVLQIAPSKLIKSVLYTNEYKTHYLPKKSGGRRRIDEPPEIVKDIQKRILNIYFRNWSERGWLDKAITGFVRGQSIKTNALFHWDMNLRYTWRLDFKNAFPSLTYNVIRQTLSHYIQQELNSYHAVQIARQNGKVVIEAFSPLYSTRKTAWFRNLLNDYKNNDGTKEFVDYLVEGLVDFLTHLVTYQKKIPQGAPTSPFLLNLVVSYSQIMKKIREYLQSEGIKARVSIYADDITISSSERIKFPVIQKVIGIIEASHIFKISREKTLSFDITKKAPLITGLKLVKVTPVNQVMKNVWLRRLPTAHKNNIAMNTVGKPLRPFIIISLGKKNTKKIRAIIHLATKRPTEKLNKKVSGYIAYLNDIYGGDLPRQISTPYKKYLSQQKQKAQD